MKAWTHHDSHHMRRLANEGSGARLPWAMALPEFQNDPAPILTIQENLKDDSPKYIRRSVASSLNDISKDNPRVTKQIAEHSIF